MLTQSGILILPGGAEAPALQDIAVGLGRAPRFAGQTRQWWSVLHHSFVVELLVRESFDPDGLTAIARPARLAALLHDAHECITADIPTTWKHVGMKELQKELDQRIAARYGVDFSSPSALIRACDQTALLAEGQIVGPPGFNALEGPASSRGLYAVEYVRTLYPSLADTIDPSGRAVTAFTSLVRQLIAC